jgi:hypothetical protein
MTQSDNLRKAMIEKAIISALLAALNRWSVEERGQRFRPLTHEERGLLGDFIDWAASDAADAILSLPALSVPEGWVAVPREVAAAEIVRVLDLWHDGSRERKARDIVQALAALSAIPSPGTAPCACGAVLAKPCNDMLCPRAPPSPRAS